MVAHLQAFHAVVDAGCKDAPPLECSVRCDELPVSMRMHFCLLSRAANVRARAYAHGRVRVCVCVCACIGLHEPHHSVISTRDHHRSSGNLVIKG